MKNIKRKEEGVSPVIATILMVAITVVLAATLYMMLPSGGGGDNPVAGDMSYRSGSSSSDNATFDLTMNTPSDADFSDLKITILDEDGNVQETIDEEESNPMGKTGDSGYKVWITHISSSEGDQEIAGGDRISLVDNGDDGLSGYEIVISVSGYSGSINGNVP